MVSNQIPRGVYTPFRPVLIVRTGAQHRQLTAAARSVGSSLAGIKKQFAAYSVPEGRLYAVKFKWTMFWLAGVITGTIFVNLNQSLCFDTQLKAAFESAGLDWKHLFFFVLQKRLVIVLLAGLSSLTFFYFPAVLLFCFYFGFVTGSLTALSTIRFGLFGILYYAGTLLPQSVLYIPMWILLSGYCSELHETLSGRQKGILKRLPVLGAVFCLLLGGVLLESFVNPRLLQYLFAFM